MLVDMASDIAWARMQLSKEPVHDVKAHKAVGRVPECFWNGGENSEAE